MKDLLDMLTTSFYVLHIMVKVSLTKLLFQLISLIP